MKEKKKKCKLRAVGSSKSKTFQIGLNRWSNVGECFQNHWSLLKHHHQLALPLLVFASQCLRELQSLFLLTGVTIFARLSGGARHRRNVSVWKKWWQGSHRASVHVRRGVERWPSPTALRCVETDKTFKIRVQTLKQTVTTNYWSTNLVHQLDIVWTFLDWSHLSSLPCCTTEQFKLTTWVREQKMLTFLE